jgi:soluble lytic murein transglycosylase-like protein
MLAAYPVRAGEYAILNNGFRLHADRHEVNGSTLRLYSEGGVTEMAASNVAGFEREEEVPVSVVLRKAETTPEAEKTAVPFPGASIPAVPPQELAAAAARKFALPESFVMSVMQAESAFRAAAVSPKGAVGLMQLMPETARILGIDPRNPKQNADGGAQYLRYLLAKYEKDPDQVVLALAAYNAGPAAVDRYHGVPPYRETREYIVRVLRNWDRQDGRK